MKTLDKGKDKVAQICDALRRETIEPAQHDAQRIKVEAQTEREKILKNAQQEADAILASARSQIEKERSVFKTSLEQAAKQSLETLRQSIEQELFQTQIEDTVNARMADPEVVAKLIQTIVQALDKQGLALDLQALIPKSVSPEKVNALLTKELMSKLHGDGVRLGDFAGGAQVKLVGKKMTIDMSSQALVETLSRYLREDFRQLFFKG